MENKELKLVKTELDGQEIKSAACEEGEKKTVDGQSTEEKPPAEPADSPDK